MVRGTEREREREREVKKREDRLSIKKLKALTFEYELWIYMKAQVLWNHRCKKHNLLYTWPVNDTGLFISTKVAPLLRPIIWSYELLDYCVKSLTSSKKRDIIVGQIS